MSLLRGKLATLRRTAPTERGAESAGCKTEDGIGEEKVLKAILLLKALTQPIPKENASSNSVRLRPMSAIDVLFANECT